MRRTDRDPFPSSRQPHGAQRHGVTRHGVRRRITLALTFVGLAFGILALDSPANAQSGPDFQIGNDAAVFDIVQVSGFLDEINADFIEQSIAEAEELDAGGVILQVNSSATVISDARLVELAERIHTARVPVYGWAGPSGATAKGGMAQLMAITDEMGIASFASFGETGELLVTEFLPEGRAELLAGLEDTTISDLDAIELGLIDQESPTLALFALGPCPGDELPGFEFFVDTTADAELIDTGVTCAGAEDGVREIASPVRLRKLSLFKGWMHSVASPAMAYLLFLVGAGLLIFEFYTAGIGVAGVVGAVCFILGSYGLDVLPTRMWALALLVIAMLGYAIDVQTGVPRAWSVIATACLVVGSLFLYDGFSISWITLLVGIIGVALSMTNGMPSMVRTRFGTPTIGREWMVGMMGEAVTEVKKDGVVMIDGAPWRAMVNRTTPIQPGDPVRVVAIEGLYLEIEPEEGGARDYREMRGPKDADESAETKEVEPAD